MDCSMQTKKSKILSIKKTREKLHQFTQKPVFVYYLACCIKLTFFVNCPSLEIIPNKLPWPWSRMHQLKLVKDEQQQTVEKNHYPYNSCCYALDLFNQQGTLCRRNYCYICFIKTKQASLRSLNWNISLSFCWFSYNGVCQDVLFW